MGVTIDTTAGGIGSLGYNADTSYINSSNNVVITRAEVWSQDDCESTREVLLESDRNMKFNSMLFRCGYQF